MLHDLNSTLQALIRTALGASAFPNPPDVSFAMPGAQPITRDTVNLFLVTLRENRELRDAEPTVERREDGTFIRKPAPVRVDCSYLVTAWSASARQPEYEEHKLLGEVMRVLLRYREIPDQVFQESMRYQPLPLRTTVLRPSLLENLSGFWQALGGKPRAVFEYTVTISVEVGELQSGGHLAQEAEVRLVDRGNPGDPVQGQGAAS